MIIFLLAPHNHRNQSRIDTRHKAILPHRHHTHHLRGKDTSYRK